MSKLIGWAIFLVGVALIGFYYVSTRESAPTGVSSAAGVASDTAPEGGAQIEITVAGEANGKVVIELYENIAPLHAERITTLAREGKYDSVVFHRVIDGFMAQTGDVMFGLEGGDMRRAGTGGSDYPDLEAEFSNEPFVAGTVGMARSANPNSANSQFFIMFAPAPHLDGGYTVVGRVIDGMDVVNAIKRGTGGNGAVEGQPDVMQSVRVISE